jgi:hypothetical protein
MFSDDVLGYYYIRKYIYQISFSLTGQTMSLLNDDINTSSSPSSSSSTQTKDYKDKTEKVSESLVGKSTSEIVELLKGKSAKEIVELLNGKSTSEIHKLLKNKYPNPPRYIDLSQFEYASKNNNEEAIDTNTWSYVTWSVRARYLDNKYTGDWVSVIGDVFTNDYFIAELLLNEKGLKEATIPSSGSGGRRSRRLTRVKSKKRANKRRTRSRK